MIKIVLFCMINSKNINSEYFAGKLKEIITDFDKFSIIAALETYESLTLSQLSLLLQKPRTTLLGHMKILLKEKLVEIDSKTSGERWGKFYKINIDFKHEFTKHRPSLYETYSESLYKDVKKLNQDQIKEGILTSRKFRKKTGLSADRLNQYCGFAYFVQRFIFNEIAEMDNTDEKSISFSETNFMKSFFILFSRGLLVSEPIHVIKYANLIGQFLADFLELSKEISEEVEQKNTDEEEILRYYLHVFGGSLKT